MAGNTFNHTSVAFEGNESTVIWRTNVGTDYTLASGIRETETMTGGGILMCDAAGSGVEAGVYSWLCSNDCGDTVEQSVR